MRTTIGFLLAATAVTYTAWADAPKSPTPERTEGPFKVSTVASGLQNPWGLELLPDGRMLVTERPGRMRLVSAEGKLSEPLKGLPEIYARGQGGLLDVTLSPQFAQDRLVYFSFSEPGEGGAGTAVARARLGDNALEDVQVVWRQTPKVDGPNHWGSRIVFRNDGTMFITTGDRYSQRPKVQDLSSTIGKVIRINADGSIPKDNPFVGKNEAKPEIWSYGHRNIQGAALNPQTNELFTIEHGARGGDELNRPQPGKNYGWPVITYGKDYSGVKIGEGTEKAGMEQPLYYWDPVIAPSGAVFYTGDAFAEWKGDLLVGSMNPGALVRLDLNNGKVVSETRYGGPLAHRIRDIKQSKDGSIYVITDSGNGSILKIEPGTGG